MNVTEYDGSQNINDYNFALFGTDGCIPCLMVAKMLSKLPDTFSGIKINCSKYRDVAQQYNIMSSPTVFVKIGEEFIVFCDTSKIIQEISKFR